MLTTNIPRHFIPNLAAFHNCQLGNVLSTYNIKKAIIVLTSKHAFLMQFYFTGV
jgi:hypothetical protein